MANTIADIAAKESLSKGLVSSVEGRSGRSWSSCLASLLFKGLERSLGKIPVAFQPAAILAGVKASLRALFQASRNSGFFGVIVKLDAQASRRDFR